MMNTTYVQIVTNRTMKWLIQAILALKFYESSSIPQVFFFFRTSFGSNPCSVEPYTAQAYNNEMEHNPYRCFNRVI